MNVFDVKIREAERQIDLSVGGQHVGYIRWKPVQYATDGVRLGVSLILIAPEFRRRGYATFLLGVLEAFHGCRVEVPPQDERTKLGAKWWASLKREQ